MSPSISLSLVVSVYNEQEVLPFFLRELENVIVGLKLETELILVNDGSTDKTLEVINQYKDSSLLNTRVIEFSRNFGHEAAMIAGIDHAKGDAIICMDSDLQHPPEQIVVMTEAFLKGVEIVTMVREHRADNSAVKNWFSKKFYQFINRLSEFQLDENASDFFLISSRVANVLRNDFRERNRFLRGFIQIVGFPKKSISYIAPKRVAGVSKYSFFKLLKLSANAIIAFSKFPLYLGIYIGGIFAFFSVAIALFTLWQYIFGNTPPSGYTTIVLFLSLSFSVLFILVGIIGTYVGYIFDENKARPIYIIKDIK
ncbi:MAG TPA: glycosyl transferase family 2 [Prolixibacteraceae bacterium]|jgi:dolichol-phosphate mannosyltransferase|nr:glycosyl transferase family 2 [Prolixibacteraceae bacterium]